MFAGPMAMLQHSINHRLWFSCFSSVLYSAPHAAPQLEQRSKAALVNTPPELLRQERIPGVYPHFYSNISPTSGKKKKKKKEWVGSHWPLPLLKPLGL